MEEDMPKLIAVDSSEEPDPDPGSILKPLSDASAKGDLGTVKQLLEEWLDSPDPRPPRVLRVPFDRLQKALEAAVAQGKLQVAAYFLGKGFRVTEAVVQVAVEAGSTETLEFLLRHGWDINNRWARHRLPSISVAIRLSSVPLVTWFLDHSASPNVELNPYKPYAPLNIAAALPSLEITRLLVTHGADVTRGSVLHSTINSSGPNCEPTLRYLLEMGAPVSALQFEDNPGRLKVTRRHVQATPLHLAVEEGKWELVRVLVEFGADWEKRDSRGWTARDMARETGEEGLIERLE